MIRRLGQWVSTEDLIDFIYAFSEDGGPADPGGALKAHAHQLRETLPPGYVIDGDAWWGRRLRKIAT